MIYDIYRCSASSASVKLLCVEQKFRPVNLCADLRREGGTSTSPSQPHPDWNCHDSQPPPPFITNLELFLFYLKHTDDWTHTHAMPIASADVFLFQPTTGLNQGPKTRAFTPPLLSCVINVHTHKHRRSSCNDLLKDTGNIPQPWSSHRG